MSTTPFFAPSTFSTGFVLAAGSRAGTGLLLKLAIGCRA